MVSTMKSRRIIFRNNKECCACDGCLSLKGLVENEELSQHRFCEQHRQFLIDRQPAKYLSASAALLNERCRMARLLFKKGVKSW